MTGLIETNKPESSLVNASPNSQKTMVLENSGLAVTEGLGNPPALFGVDYNALEVGVYRVRLVESQGVLGDHVELPAERREGLARNAVGVAGRCHVGAGLVDFGVDGESGAVGGLVTLDNVAVLVAEDEVRDLDEGEVHGERVEPWKA